MTIVEFLLARIAEDETAANHARWAMQGEWFATAEDKIDEFVRRNSPERVLAECQAKRAIVEENPLELVAVETLGGETLREDVAWVPGELRHLAAVYAGHPDYQEGWRP